MSITRKGLDGSDVYVYTDGEKFICQACLLLPASDVAETGFERLSLCVANWADMVSHLEMHRAAGHTVPGYALAEVPERP